MLSERLLKAHRNIVKKCEWEKGREFKKIEENIDIQTETYIYFFLNRETSVNNIFFPLAL